MKKLLLAILLCAARTRARGAKFDARRPDTRGRAPTPPRRLHSSLSMPYFSFAQSLNPRS